MAYISHGNTIKDFIQKSVKLKPGPPECYRLKTEKINIDDKGKLRKWTFGNKDTTKENKIILMVGETGTGKTTLINTMVNHILGVKWEDKIWFEITKEKNVKQTESQTSEITVYEVFPEQGSLSLTIVDTPGYGDTRGIENDQEIVEKLQMLFTSETGVHEIDAVCLVVKASDNRISEKEYYIFDSVLSLFGKDVEKNVVIMITHSSGVRNKNVIAAIEEAKILCARNEKDQPVHFWFDNCQSQGYDEDYMEDYKSAWDKGVNSMKSFLAFLQRKERKSLRMTSDVIQTRKQVEASIHNLIDRMNIKETKQQELTQIQITLRLNDEKLKNDENFTFEIPESYREKENNDAGDSTVCDKCHENCHPVDCWWVSDLSWCSVMKDGKCTVCTGKCSHKEHSKGRKIYVTKTKTVKITAKELKERYAEEMRNSKDLESVLTRELQRVETEKNSLLQVIMEHIVKLRDNSLNPIALHILGHVDYLMQRVQEIRNQEWIQILRDLKHMGGKREVAVNYVKEKFGSLFKQSAK